MRFLLETYRSLFLTETETVFLFYVLDLFYLILKSKLFQNAIIQKDLNKACLLY